MPIAFTSDTAGTYSDGNAFSLTWTVEAMTHQPPLPAAECIRQMVVGRSTAAGGPPVLLSLIGDPFANGPDRSGKYRLRAIAVALNYISQLFYRTLTLPTPPAPDGDGVYWFAQSAVETYTLIDLLADAGHAELETRVCSAAWLVQTYDLLAILEWYQVDYDESDPENPLVGLMQYTAEP